MLFTAVLLLTLHVEPAARPRATVWVKPLGQALFIVAGPLFPTANGLPWVSAPIGASVRTSELTTLELELSWFSGASGCGGGFPRACRSFGQWYAALGFSFDPDGALDGLFVSPRASVSRWWMEGTVAVSITGLATVPAVDAFEFMAGVDAGYRWIVGPVAIAFAPGFSIGSTFPGLGRATAGPWIGNPPSDDVSHLVFGVNLNFLRLGLWF